MADTLTPAVEAAFDRLDASIEASFDRIDALCAQILNRFQERINALDCKFSWDLKPHSLCPEVLDPCDATDDAEISDGTQLFVRGGSLLPHSDVDDSPGGLLVSEGAFVPPETPQPLHDVMDQKGEGSVLIEVGLAGFHKCMPSVAHMGLLSDAPPDQWAKEVAEILVQSPVSVSGDSFKIEALGVFAPIVAHDSRGLHALYPFVEMQHSGALCHGNAILGFDLSYYMGIRDKGGGFEVLQKELHHQGNIKNCLVVIFLDFGSLHTFIDLSLVKGLSWPIAHIHQFDFLRSNFLLANGGMVLSHGCSQVRFRVQDYGCVDDFELSSHMGIRDKGSGFIGWIWRTDLRWLRKQHGLQCFHVYTIWNCCGLCLWRFCGRQFQLALCILGRADSRKFLEPNESWRYAFWGDLVYLRLIPYQHKSLASHPFHELQPKFYGPYGILDKVGSVAYKLKLPPNSKLYSYDIPHTCGPEPAICCQFNFARMRGFMYELCPWGEHPVETNQENVQERALILLDQYRKKSTLYRTNTLLIPLGDDFRYISIDEAEAQFRNYQMLFDYINSNPGLNTEAKFGTLEDYFQTLREEAERINHSLPGEIGSGQVGGFPSLSGDFFTYADRQQDYWSGYYVSRPFFKAVDRVLEQTLRTTDMMMAFLLGYCQRAQCEKLPMGFSYKLAAARRNLALFQHHDGVTGTAKDHVVLDYGTRMHTSLQDLQIFMSKAIEVLLGIRHEKNDNNPSQFEPEQVRSKYDVQPVHRAIMAREGTRQSVVFFNPLGQTREEVVMLIVNRPDVTVLDSNWTCVQSQISPELQHDKSKIFTGRHRVYWKASVPALGLQTYYIANGFVGCEKAKPAKLRFFSKSMSISCPTPYACSKAEVDVAEIQNRHQILTFDVNHGLLQKISYKNGSQNVVGEEIAMYSSWGSGAYLFKPNGDAQPIIEAGGQMVISEGPLVQEVYSYPKTAWEKSPISHSTRIYNGENTVQEFLIEKEYHVELLSQDFNDMELIVRYKTDIDNKRIFFSDLNGFQMSRRETYDKIPTQGNYYPMPSLAFMQGSNGQRFSVHSRQSLGVASLRNGWLEIMLDRRLVKDDGRGLGQGVMDNRAMNVVFHIVVESNISATSNPVSNPLPLSPSLLSHRVNAHLNYPLHAFIAKKPEELSVQPPPRFFSPLAAPLPCDLHIVSFKVPQPLKYSQQPIGDSRFVLILQRQNWDPSYCRRGRSGCTRFADETVNLFYMFKELSVLNARATSLNLLHEDTDMLGYTEQFGDVAQDGHVLISPMEVQAYKLELRPHK